MILVTGGTGLVGAHLLYHLTLSENKIRATYRSIETLKKVKEVFSFYENSFDEKFSKIEWVLANITDVPSLLPVFKDVKKVYHCAAMISFKERDYRKMRQVNIGGTANVVNLSIDAGVEKICFVGSIASIGNAVKGKIITEENEWNDHANHSGYSITKFGAEMEVWRASQEGIKVVIVNPGVILGSGFWNTGSSKIFTKVNNGLRFYTEGITGFIGVKDVVKSMIFLTNSNITGERFILVSENKSFKEVLFLIADAFNVKRPKIGVKKWQTAILWMVDSFFCKFTSKEPLLTKYSAKSAHNISKYSSSKITKVLENDFQKIAQVVKEVSEDFNA